jgi:hypothetical protein
MRHENLMKPINSSYFRVKVLSCCLTLIFLLPACSGGSATDPSLSSNTGTNNQGGGSQGGGQPADPGAFPYVADGPYADILWECTASWVFQPCSFDKLPLIGQETDNPDVEDVLDRLLVSHDWMGETRRIVLERLPSDVLLLFRSTTGIVITQDSSGNQFFLGKVYVDPVFFWLTPEQREDIPQGARGLQTSDGLSFRMPWRYIRDGVPLRFQGPDTGSRAEDDMVSAAAVVLFHELAHAVDWMPPSEFANVGRPEDAPLTGQAEAWQENFPIRSGAQTTNLPLYELAQVRFGEADATAAQSDIQPAELVAPFAEEGGVRFYSYINAAEDFATAFETAMMAFYFGYDQETAITGNTTSSANDEIVVWGQRGRIGEQQVYVRVLSAVQTIDPPNLSAVESFLASQPPAIQMRTGVTWLESAGSTQ